MPPSSASMMSPLASKTMSRESACGRCCCAPLLVTAFHCVRQRERGVSAEKAAGRSCWRRPIGERVVAGPFDAIRSRGGCRSPPMNTRFGLFRVGDEREVRVPLAARRAHAFLRRLNADEIPAALVGLGGSICVQLPPAVERKTPSSRPLRIVAAKTTLLPAELSRGDLRFAGGTGGGDRVARGAVDALPRLTAVIASVDAVVVATGVVAQVVSGVADEVTDAAGGQAGTGLPG